MLSKSELWDLIDGLIRSNSNLALYDLELPRGKGTLNVFITKINVPVIDSTITADSTIVNDSEITSEVVAKNNMSFERMTLEEPEPGEKSGVTHEDCTLVSKLLDECGEIDYLRLEAGLVVSSPGVNRQLRRPEHFVQALGERVKVSYRDLAGVAKTSTGILKSFENDCLSIEAEAAELDKKAKTKVAPLEQGPMLIAINLGDVNKAQVDFLF